MAASTVAQDEQPISRTYQYRKVMKPMLERKRRARINRCLDELKELLVGALQAEGESVSRLEKADVLELTVRHLHKLRRSQQLSESSAGERFRQGFVHCAQEVSKYISTVVSTPTGTALDLSVSSRLVSHLEQCIRSIEGPQLLHHPHPPPPPPVMPLPMPQGSPTRGPGGGYGQVPPMMSPSSASSHPHHHHPPSSSSSGGTLNILTSYTPPSSPISPGSSSSSQKVYYIPSSASVGGQSSASPHSSTGSLSPIPPAHYNSLYIHSGNNHNSQPLSLCTKSPDSDEPFDLSTGVWRPW